MAISMIAAMAKNRVIGKDNSMPWHIPAELKRFKKITLGGTLIMGRKTFESIGKPLPGRQTIVITRDQNYSAEGCAIAHSIEEAIAMAPADKEIFIAGGSQIYEQAFSRIDRMYLTEIDLDIDGDAYLPDFDLSSFQRVEHETIESEPPFTCSTYQRNE